VDGGRTVSDDLVMRWEEMQALFAATHVDEIAAPQRWLRGLTHPAIVAITAALAMATSVGLAWRQSGCRFKRRSDQGSGGFPVGWAFPSDRLGVPGRSSDLD
jgi:hypothetical protein